MRDVPRPVVAWITRPGPTRTLASRPFVQRHAAYYRIAKSIVITKYDGANYAVDSDEPIAVRYRALFWTDFPGYNGGPRFDPRRWSALCHRLAKFLAFVDSKREANADLLAMNDAELYAEEETCEREAQAWMIRARAAKLLRSSHG